MRASPEQRRYGGGWLAAAAAALALAASGGLAQDAELPPMCSGLGRPDDRGRFVATADLLRAHSPLDGDAPLALVNRTPAGALSPDYAPRDLVDVETLRPARWWECTPPRKQCMRRAAARAYRDLADAMRRDGLRPLVSSAFRAYRVQCSTFLGWAERERDGFCAASSASALPGHSQHQLGTTIDLFTRDWTEGGDKFRPGYGCSAGGRWIAEHAHEHGFVLPYPLHPDYRQPGSACAAIEGGEERSDPRTGYRYEPWHLRWIGVVEAMRFEEARAESGVGTASEITLEQWLRAELGEADPIGPPVCDGCNCDRCATFSEESSPCAAPSMVLDEEGRPRPAEGSPTLLDASLARDGGRLVLTARVRVPRNTWTQPPIVTPASGAFFRRGDRRAQLLERAPRTFAPIGGAWRLAIGFDRGRRSWPWRSALVSPTRDATPNGLDARIPAAPGEVTVAIPMEGVAPGTVVRVGLARGGAVDAQRELVAP